jgi:hypothetical protein
LRLNARSWADHGSRPEGGPTDLLELDVTALTGLRVPQQELRVAEDGGQEVVEVVGDPAGELTHGLHSLGVSQLLLEPLLRRDVAHVGENPGLSPILARASVTSTSNVVPSGRRWSHSKDWTSPARARRIRSAARFSLSTPPGCRGGESSAGERPRRSSPRSAVQVASARIAVDDPQVLQQEDPVARGLVERAVALLAGLEGLLGPLAVGDVPDDRQEPLLAGDGGGAEGDLRPERRTVAPGARATRTSGGPRRAPASCGGRPPRRCTEARWRWRRGDRVEAPPPG